MSTRRLRVGVVGMRGIGNTHAGVYQSDSLSELAAVCDIDRGRADESAAARGGVELLQTGFAQQVNAAVGRDARQVPPAAGSQRRLRARRRLEADEAGIVGGSQKGAGGFEAQAV